ncbi:AMP-dependent synthetase [Parazoarcus communis]|uniref:AMP-dependent synthetase n=1 Tax=Parazoarcus communis TaxID=41977 RepID=A0A2U8H625_9RHOO|nr:AMP-binding protein [Parazoarcus communis]AWI81098.1 AMP-dependent synthetase [Parazoarcus communis]
MNVAQLLARSARVHPERAAVLLGERVLFDYRELADRAARIAGYLRGQAGLKLGDRVALFMHNCPEYLEVLYGAWWAGLAVVPINAKLHAREAAYVVEDSGAAALFVSEDFAEELTGLLPGDGPTLHVPGSDAYNALFESAPLALQSCDANALAWLFYTSGTTGRPKGVMQTHRNLVTMAACYFMDVDAVTSDDVMVYAAPMSHGAGLYNFMQVIKAARHLIPESGGFDADELITLSQRIGGLTLFAAPTMVKRLVDRIEAVGVAPSGFKTIVYGGGPMYVEDIRRALDVMGDRFVQIYGQGESPMTITALSREQLAERTHPRWAQRIASVGCAQALVEVMVADDSGNAAPLGTTGEVLVRGDSVMAGYWGNVDATASALRDGWLWTGDLGVMDEDGYLTLKDRSKDVIISGGSNIYPREVEEVLLMHQAVSEVSVIGRPHPEWGEEVIACVVCRPGARADAAELDALCLAHIARFKRPKEYHFLDEMPKNNYGKVLKTELRALINAQ